MSNLQGVTDLIARLLAPCQSEHTYDADKEEAAKALKAYEKETAVWSENYAALERKVAELTRERDALADGKDGWKSSSNEYERLFRNAEAKVARLEGALRPFCFFNEDEPESDVQHAWEIRYQDRFKDWIDFGDIVAARAALKGDTND